MPGEATPSSERCPRCNAQLVSGACWRQGCGYGITTAARGRRKRRDGRRPPHSTADTSKGAYSGLLHGDTQSEYRRILGVIREHGPVTRKQIEIATGLGPNIVSGRCNELLQMHSLARLPTTRRNPGTGVHAQLLVLSNKLEEYTRSLL